MEINRRSIHIAPVRSLVRPYACCIRIIFLSGSIMSTQKGNNSRSRPQKHKNRTAFKNSLHDTSHQTKKMNSLQVHDVCTRCKEIIEWKIKYKRYKPLTQPKKCNVCEQKTVKLAYHVMCTPCGRKLDKCTKCCESKEVIPGPDERKPYKMNRELRFVLKELPERRRRTFLRYLEKKQQEPLGDLTEEEEREELQQKLNSLKLADNDDSEDGSDFSLSDDSDVEENK